MSGCFVDSGDDDGDLIDDGSGVVAVEDDRDTRDVVVEEEDVDVVTECRTECDDERTDCVLDCVGDSCIADCDTDESECVTDCD
jgi:hypothetical protein